MAGLSTNSDGPHHYHNHRHHQHEVSMLYHDCLQYHQNHYMIFLIMFASNIIRIIIIRIIISSLLCQGSYVCSVGEVGGRGYSPPPPTNTLLPSLIPKHVYSCV